MEIIPVNFTEKTERTPAGTAAVQEKAADLERQAVEAIGKNFVKASAESVNEALEKMGTASKEKNAQAASGGQPAGLQRLNSLLLELMGKEGAVRYPALLSFLSRYGYRCFHADAALDRLRKRLDQTTEFPHEIGLFLGYPLGDVKGFIQNSGKNSKCCGSWKVYCNESETEKLFEKFQKCRLVYCRLFLEGRSVIQLTVAA